MCRRDFFQIFLCFIFNVSLGIAPKRKFFDIQRNTRVGSGGQFTSNRLSCHHMAFQTSLEHGVPMQERRMFALILFDVENKDKARSAIPNHHHNYYQI